MDITSGGAGQASRERETQARSGVPVVGRSALSGVEEVRRERTRHPRPVVGDIDPYGAGQPDGPHGDARTGMAQAVVEERADDAFEQRGETPAVSSGSSPTTVTPGARGPSGPSSATVCASRSSTGSTTAVPGELRAPARASSSRVSQIARMDCAASATAVWQVRVSCSERGRSCSQSSSAMIWASGLRSSCDSSLVSCCSCRSTARIRSRSASNEPPSWVSSVGPARPRKRSSESAALHRAAWSVMVCTGRSARPTASRVRA